MSRSLTSFPVVADPSVVDGLLPAMAAALEGSGPALLPVPAADAGLRASLIAAMRPDDPDRAPGGRGHRGRDRHLRVERSTQGRAAEHLRPDLGRGRAAPADRRSGHLAARAPRLAHRRAAGDHPVAATRAPRRWPWTSPSPSAQTRSSRRPGPCRPGPAASRRTPRSSPPSSTRLLDAGGAAVEALASYDAILVGSAATPDALAERARAGRRADPAVVRHERDVGWVLLRRATARRHQRAAARRRTTGSSCRVRRCSRATGWRLP